jgi:splicing factor 3B subunit 3
MKRLHDKRKPLALVESIPAMNPLLDSKVANLTWEDAPQIYNICDNGPEVASG